MSLRAATARLLACAAALLAAAPALAASPPVIVPGREAEILALLAPYRPGAPLPDVPGWAVKDVSIAATSIHVGLEGPAGATAAVDFAWPGEPRAASGEHTASFLVRRTCPPAGCPPAVDAIVAAVTAHDAGTFWASAPRPARRVHPPPPPTSPGAPVRSTPRAYHPGTWAFAAACLLLLLAGLALPRLRRPPAPPAPPAAPAPAPAPSLDPLALTACLALVGVTAATLAGFTFVNDDSGYMIRADREPWVFNPQLRLLGVQLPFWLATHAPDPAAAFVLLELAAIAACALALRATLRGAGWTPAEATLAAALFATTRPFVKLGSWGAGVQQLLAWALLLAALGAGRRATHAPAARDRAAGALTCFGLVGLATLSKGPLALLAAPALWLWTLGGPRRALRYALPVALTAFAALPLLLEQARAEDVHAGTTRLAENLAEMGRWLARAVTPVLPALAIAFLVRTRTLDPRALWRALRDLARAIPARPALIALALVPLSLAPFLFNAHYFAGYYLGPALAWIAALLALLLPRIVPRGPLAWAAAVAIVALWIPWRALDHLHGPEFHGHRVERFLADAREALADLPAAPVAVVLTADCPGDPAATPASAKSLARLHRYNEHGDGLRWVTGWHDLPVLLADDPAAAPPPAGAVHLSYCRESRPLVSRAGTAPAPPPAQTPDVQRQKPAAHPAP